MKISRRKFIEASALTAATSLVSQGIAGQEKGGASNPRRPALPQGLKNFSAHDRKVQPLLLRMTLEEKIGQMIQAEQSALQDIGDIEKYFLGSLLSGGSSDPKSGNG